MLSSYSIVRYVPDPIADERINIGVIVVGEGVMRTRFIEDWRRIQQFGAEDISFLHDFVHDLEKVTNTWQVESDDKQDWSIDTLTKLSAGWINSIQISTPRASLRTPDELLREISGIFLRERSRTDVATIRVENDLRERESRPFTKRDVVMLATREVETALANRFGDRFERIVKRNSPVRGRVEEHDFDIVGENGHVLFAANGLSFDGRDTPSRLRDIDATAWAIDDVRKEDADIALAIIVRPPQSTSKLYARTERIFPNLGAEIVTDDHIDEWAARVARHVRRDEDTGVVSLLSPA